MSVRFTILASGSEGNCAALQLDAATVFIDIGLNPRVLDPRLAAANISRYSLRAVLLSHTHGDHLNNLALERLAADRVPVYCHAEHSRRLLNGCRPFIHLYHLGLVRHFTSHTPLQLLPTLSVLPIPVPHDSDPTFAFRFDGTPDLFGPTWRIGFASDLGSWSDELVAAFAEVDILAIEFNHDVQLQRSSSRTSYLIERVLSDRGHLSNDQAADYLRALLPINRRLRHLVQLHLSRECNRPELAQATARAVLEQVPAAQTVQVHTTEKDTVGPSLLLDWAGKRQTRQQVPRDEPCSPQKKSDQTA
jgi:phosphoribosyl 1,2-cyclic phosphodiesterase